MKMLRTIVTTILILIIGACAILFAYYKIFLDKPGFFRQFDNEHEVREHLINDLVLYGENKNDTIEYMQQHLSDGEGCGPLRDVTLPNLDCPNDCPPVTDETPNSVMLCLARSSDVFLQYKISLFFEYNKLNDINVALHSGLP